MSVKLSIIIVSYNSAKFIGKCIDSIEHNLPKNSEIIVVDSGSEDETTEILEKYKNIKLIKSQTNIGYGKGNNLGFRLSKGEYILILNPDTTVAKESVQKLLDYIDSHSEAGLVAPKLIQDNGKVQPTVRKLPTIKGALAEYYFKIKNAYEAYIPDPDSPLEVESVVGAALMIKRDVFEKIGGFDERYFMYFEDLELCRKLHNLGYKIIYLPDAVVYHKVGGTQTYPERNQTWIQKSAEIYHGRLYGFVLYLILRLRNIFR